MRNPLFAMLLVVVGSAAGGCNRADDGSAAGRDPDGQARTTVAVDPDAAVPGKIRVLLVDGQNNHEWRKTTPLLRAALTTSGRFAVDVVTTPGQGRPTDDFRPDFAAYKVVVSNYNGAPWPAATRAAFEQFVRGGGGFVSVHAADNAFPDWAEYNKMIGVGGWGGRTEADGPMLRVRTGRVIADRTPGPRGSHGRRHEFVVEHLDPAHPIVAGLPARWRHAADELYDRLGGPAEHVAVVATAHSTRETGGSGEHEPMLMAVGYGGGRVFHTTLGHDETAIKCVGFVTTLRRGTEWAATGAVTQPPPADFPTADRAVVWEPK